MSKPKARFAINVLENHNSELLLLKRSPGRRMGAGLWGFAAGHIEEHEDPQVCSLRELREEIGTKHRVELLNTLGPVKDSFYGGIYHVYLFHYRWIEGTIELDWEHTEYTWVTREDYGQYYVMDGVDEDIHYFGIWPRRFLNADKIAAMTLGEHTANA